ncbi:MAG: aspartate aminotransferase family protein, partial [Alphaproteobacteria bacterium]|nr:aspartate aminotransferase family protein [Alphaproteobacteria bacterium]NDA19111.1 aspartate aminotransferase family protein [Alphaproteobacteria bacterium]
CYPSQGTIDGKSGDHILLAPPFIISIDEMDMLVARLDSAIKTSLPA